MERREQALDYSTLQQLSAASSPNLYVSIARCSSLSLFVQHLVTDEAVVASLTRLRHLKINVGSELLFDSRGFEDGDDAPSLRLQVLI